MNIITACLIRKSQQKIFGATINNVVLQTLWSKTKGTRSFTSKKDDIASSSSMKKHASTTIKKHNTSSKLINTRVRTRAWMPPSPPEVTTEHDFENQTTIYPGMQRSHVSPSSSISQEEDEKSSNTSNFDVSFLGTGIGVPTTTRGTPCTALRLNWNIEKKNSNFQNGIWLFDCGECTQLQIQRSNVIKAIKITKFFITKSHGDHTFGLPGALCLMGKDRDRSSPPIEIYGPQGLREWLRIAIRYNYARVVPNYIVHELMNIPMASLDSSNNISFDYNIDKSSWVNRCNNNKIVLQPDEQFGEVGEGKDIYPTYTNTFSSDDNMPIYQVLDEGEVTVHAVPTISSLLSAPCVGYVINECSKPGRLNPESITPIIKKNYDALEQKGYKHPMKVLATIKSLPKGELFTFPDGNTVRQQDVVEGERIGRKIVICGNAFNNKSLEELGCNADMLVHEATNLYSPIFNEETSSLLGTMNGDYVTPYAAGLFASKIKAKKLILNHFPSRYNGDANWESMCTMRNFEKQAIEGSKNWLNDHTAVSSWDFMTLPIPSN